MLKLERKSKSRDVSVSIKEYGRLFTPSFLRALAIAFAIHFFGIILFQVSPFKIVHVETIFPPTQVKIDFLPLIDSGVLAELENEPTTMPQIPEPAMSRPQIHGMPHVKPIRTIAHPKLTRVSSYPFEKLEGKYYYTDFIDLGPSKQHKTMPLNIRLFGELSKMTYTLDGFDEKEYALKNRQRNELRRQIVSYRVKVENKTGKIFWYEQINSPERKKTSKIAKKILTSLQFEKNQHGFTSEGDVEIELLVTEKEQSL